MKKTLMFLPIIVGLTAITACDSGAGNSKKHKTKESYSLSFVSPDNTIVASGFETTIYEDELVIVTLTPIEDYALPEEISVVSGNGKMTYEYSREAGTVSFYAICDVSISAKGVILPVLQTKTFISGNSINCEKYTYEADSRRVKNIVCSYGDVDKPESIIDSEIYEYEYEPESKNYKITCNEIYDSVYKFSYCEEYFYNNKGLLEKCNFTYDVGGGERKTNVTKHFYDELDREIKETIEYQDDTMEYYLGHQYLYTYIGTNHSFSKEESIDYDEEGDHAIFQRSKEEWVVDEHDRQISSNYYYSSTESVEDYRLYEQTVNEYNEKGLLTCVKRYDCLIEGHETDPYIMSTFQYDLGGRVTVEEEIQYDLEGNTVEISSKNKIVRNYNEYNLLVSETWSVFWGGEEEEDCVATYTYVPIEEAR